MWKVPCLVLLSVFLATWSPSVDAEDTNCKGKEASLAKLDTAKEAMDRVKQFLPNCNQHERNSTHPSCGKQDKSIGYLDAAMDLVKSAIELYPKNPDEIKEPVPKYGKQTDCSSILAKGYNVSGVYTVYLTNDEGVERSLDVFCDMQTAKGGWTVIQRRGNFPVQEDFFRDWAAYKKGFGDIKKDFWIGNDNLYDLTNKSSYSIRFDLVDADGSKGYAVYKSFSVEGEVNRYRLHISGYSGSIGDAMESAHNRRFFSTKDKQVSESRYGRSCAKDWKGGWWYADCYEANLNGLYRKGSWSDGRTVNRIPWRHQNCLGASEMKLKRN